jgi:hypothetical protein
MEGTGLATWGEKTNVLSAMPSATFFPLLWHYRDFLLFLAKELLSSLERPFE